MAKQEMDVTRSQRGWTPWEQLFEGYWRSGLSPESSKSQLDMDVYEENDEIVVNAELPGMSIDDIRVSIMDNNILTIRGEKKKEEEESGKAFYRAERVFGVITRAVALPAEIDPEQVRATFKDGMLEVRLPKSPEAKKKQIEVKVGE
jgi:HSP20 family protein